MLESYLYLFAYIGVRHINCFACLHIVYPMLPVSLDCPFLISPSVFHNVCLWSYFFEWKLTSQVIIIPVLITLNLVWFNPPFLWICLYQVRVITVFTVFRLLTDFVCLYTYEFWLSLCKIVRSSIILLLPLFMIVEMPSCYKKSMSM